MGMYVSQVSTCAPNMGAAYTAGLRETFVNLRMSIAIQF